jgi:hypothetical protein
MPRVGFNMNELVWNINSRAKGLVTDFAYVHKRLAGVPPAPPKILNTKINIRKKSPMRKSAAPVRGLKIFS